ncbi:uncharacterized protein LOC111066911 [Drosophila obscura]|uniref:uncharacterized protein LOC111066911 n=1 Tax=Drosophila obscura TaxID=7282 RepID=UPI001BB278B8|nr:uncharacterized protein LOC111066911 [Drosophila obscura]
MKWRSSLLLLVALCASCRGICARDPQADQWEVLSELGRQVEEIYRYEMSRGANSEEVLNKLHSSSHEVVLRAGVEAIGLANKLQNDITKSVASFVDRVGIAMGQLQSFLFRERNRYRSQSLQDAMEVLSEVNAAILDLRTSLGHINSQQASNDQWERQTADEWKQMAQVLVENVRQSTAGTGTARARKITQGFRIRNGLRLHACQEEYEWFQTRYYLELQEPLEICQSSTDELILATVNCRNFSNECHNAVRKARSGLKGVPEELDRFRDQANHLLFVREESIQCLAKVLEEFTADRLIVERQLQDIIEQYEQKVSPETSEKWGNN